MHCAFAKYEQGFKRKNEYLERRKIKRTGEIDKGVEIELQNRGLQGRLEDPLLSNIPEGGGMRNEAIGFNKGMGGEDESSLGLGGMGQFEESQSVRDLDNSIKRGAKLIANGDKDKDIVGINSLEEVRKIEKKRLKKEKKKKMKNKRGSSNEKEKEEESKE
jgi:hypothetical protein